MFNSQTHGQSDGKLQSRSDINNYVLEFARHHRFKSIHGVTLPSDIGIQEMDLQKLLDEHEIDSPMTCVEKNSATFKKTKKLGINRVDFQNKEFKDFRLIYDNVEDGMLMDVERLFGEATADRIEPPALDEDGEACHSETIEQFYYNLDDAFDEDEPFIYVLDSMDGLDTEDDQDKFAAQKKAHRKGTNTAGSYGMAKAKKNSVGLRQVAARLRETGCILIIISQTRDNTKATGPFSPRKTRFFLEIERRLPSNWPNLTGNGLVIRNAVLQNCIELNPRCRALRFPIAATRTLPEQALAGETAFLTLVPWRRACEL